MRFTIIQKLLLITLLSLSSSVFADEKIDWTGPYAGINVGFDKSDLKLTCATCTVNYSNLSTGDSIKQNSSNALYGAQIGYNFILNNFLLGTELSYQDLNLNKKTWSASNQDDTFTSKLKSTVTLSGRAGKVFDSLAVYGKAGILLSDYSLKIQDYNVNGDGTPSYNNQGGGKDSKWLPGLSIGLGGEYMINPKISLGAEYAYSHLFSRDLNSGGYNQTYIMKTDNFDTHTAQLKLNYHF
jgi:outer membrane immunogenic protein